MHAFPSALQLEMYATKQPLNVIYASVLLDLNTNPDHFSYFWNGEQVDTMTADLIISQLLFLDAEDQEKDIKLFINSPGGSVTAGTFVAYKKSNQNIFLIVFFLFCMNIIILQYLVA